MAKLRVAVLAFLLTVGCRAAQREAGPDVDAQLLQEVRTLRVAVQTMAADVRTVKDQLAERSDEEAPEASSAWPDALWEERGPDTNALAKIKLPDNATKDDVREYVRAIIRASEGQNSFSSDDPQVAMLAKIGPDHVDVLLEAGASVGDGTGGFYLPMAVERLVRPEHCDLVVAALPCNRELASIVVRMGWEREAKDVLIEGLRDSPGSLSAEWLAAVAALRDPTTYEGLVAHFVAHRYERHAVYEAIKDLPGLDVGRAVAEAWQQAKRGDLDEAMDMVPIAAEFGHTDALALAFQVVSDPEAHSYFVQQARRIIFRHTDARGTRGELGQWFKSNKDKLVFDAQTKEFSVPSE